MDVRRLGPEWAAQAAQVHRAAFDAALPWLAGLHPPAEDEWFYRERVFPAGPVEGVFIGSVLAGVMASRVDWIDQLYVRPAMQGLGVGSALLATAQAGAEHLLLHTFQRNHPARQFYERRGFIAVSTTDGGGNEEREPDVLYRWQRANPSPPVAAGPAGR